jgi:hypothetical protein
VTIYVYRNGEEIRSWPEEEFRALISSGEILPDDYFRHEGTTEWSLVSSYIPSNQQEADRLPKTPAAKVHHDWRLDPATEKQINYLASFGVAAPVGLTKGEASDLIDRCTNDPEALARQAQLRETRYEQEKRDRAAFPSSYLKADIASAARELDAIKERRNKTRSEISAKKKQLAASQRKFEQAANDDERADIQVEIDNIKTDLEAAESELGDFPVELEDAQADLKVARSRRLSFWKATFKEDWALTEEENRLIEFADTIDQLYATYGRYFKVPTNKQVSDVLEVMDKDSRDWDKREPHAFYTRLEATVPDCTRKTVKRVASSPSQGCSVLLIATVVLVVCYLIIH